MRWRGRRGGGEVGVERRRAGVGGRGRPKVELAKEFGNVVWLGELSEAIGWGMRIQVSDCREWLRE
jgi:hypothetical protein